MLQLCKQNFINNWIFSLHIDYECEIKKFVLNICFDKYWIRCLNQIFGLNVVPVSGCAGFDAQPG